MNGSGTIQYIRAQVLENRLLTDGLWFLRLRAAGLEGALPGQFVQLNCGRDFTVPRPFSILDTHPANQTIDILYRLVGEGTERMTTWQKGFETPLLGPVGKPFSEPANGAKALLVAGGVGMAPLDFLARRLAAQGVATTLLWGIESDSPFPVELDPGRAGLEEGYAVRHLQSHGVVSRLASLTSRAGFFQGYVTELAAHCLQQWSPEERAAGMLYSCGPLPMMAALAQVANRFGMRGEASLEARMACGFGVCVGCVVWIGDAETGYYRRVCVDGPVFGLDQVDWSKSC
ncbi:MAG: dihydroorotate dehydrogenase electron transfer subunit [Magnetococcales bacterium]|nr:dihydroorotate dehydrogenase electron transfer subunit [Magnetococcales bacterium]